MIFLSVGKQTNTAKALHIGFLENLKLFGMVHTLNDLVRLLRPYLDDFGSYFLQFQTEYDSINLHYGNIMRITFSK